MVRAHPYGELTEVDPASSRMRIPWEFGCRGPLWIRTHRFDWGLERPQTIVFASDLHLGHWWTESVPGELLAAVEKTGCDRVILGGDLIDHRRALLCLANLLEELGKRTQVLAIAGNHDRCVAESELAAVVQKSGGRWLPREPVRGEISIDASASRVDDDSARILCLHEPRHFPEALAAGYRLVFAGHLHGGQCVWWTSRGRLFPVAWIDRWHRLRLDEGRTTMLISRGMADTFPFRWNCPREVICCEIE